MQQHTLDSPIGKLTITIQDGKVIKLAFGEDLSASHQPFYKSSSHTHNESSCHPCEGRDPSGDSRMRGNDEAKSGNDGIMIRGNDGIVMREGNKSNNGNDCLHILNQELLTYFANPTHTFNIEYELTGTPFQKNVWKTLKTIPAGHTMTYGELAKKLRSSPRAIGQACRNNPIPIIIPCHRIVGANNKGGFAGQTKGKLMAVKEFLLSHENNTRDPKQKALY